MHLITAILIRFVIPWVIISLKTKHNQEKLLPNKNENSKEENE